MSAGYGAGLFGTTLSEDLAVRQLGEGLAHVQQLAAERLQAETEARAGLECRAAFCRQDDGYTPTWSEWFSDEAQARAWVEAEKNQNAGVSGGVQFRHPA